MEVCSVMTIATLLVNALAILCGLIHKPAFMYVLFGFAWTAFFGIYEKLTWIWYEKVLRNETDEVMVNVKIAHMVTMIIVMAALYVYAYFKNPGCVQSCRQFNYLPCIVSGCINSAPTGI